MILKIQEHLSSVTNNLINLHVINTNLMYIYTYTCKFNIEELFIAKPGYLSVWLILYIVIGEIKQKNSICHNKFIFQLKLLNFCLNIPNFAPKFMVDL